MYITCKKCSTSFVVRVDQIGPFGRKVRCSKCKHMWHEEAGSVADPFIMPPLDNTTFPEVEILLPAIMPRKHKKSSHTTSTVLALLALIGFIFATIKYQPTISYEDPVTISHTKLYHIGDSKIFASYKLTNASDNSVPMTAILVNVYDKSHQLLSSHHIEHNQALLPHQSIYLQTDRFDAKGDVNEVDLRIWHWWDIRFTFQILLKDYYGKVVKILNRGNVR